jgi:hypothetical protein
MSMLPVWIVSSLNGKLGIQCPYKDCGGKAVVSRQWGQPRLVPRGDKDSHDAPEPLFVMVVGRSCTYCSRSSQVPERFKGGRPRG